MIVAPATVTVVVAVGIAMTTVELDRTNVCDDAPDEGTGFGSAQKVSTLLISRITDLLHVTAVKVGAGSCVIWKVDERVRIQPLVCIGIDLLLSAVKEMLNDEASH